MNEHSCKQPINESRSVIELALAERMRDERKRQVPTSVNAQKM